MTDDPYIKEAIRRLAEIDTASDWTMKDADNRIVKSFAEAIAADKWQPPVDPRVEAVVALLRDDGLGKAYAESRAAEIVKLVEGGA